MEIGSRMFVLLVLGVWVKVREYREYKGKVVVLVFLRVRYRDVFYIYRYYEGYFWVYFMYY